MKRVSVILTTFNGEKTLERTIISILKQDGINSSFEIELIIVDDCSTDKTTDIIKKYDCLYFSTGSNSGGPNKGRNIGLKKASGDYICIVDQDDEWASHRIKSLLPYLEKVPIVTSGYTIEDQPKRKRIHRVAQSEIGYLYFNKNATFLKKLTKSQSGQNTYLSSIIFTSELKKVGFEEHFGMVDFDWILRLFHNQDSIEVCDSLYTRFVDGSNLSLNESYRRKDFYYSLITIENFENQFPKQVKVANLRIHGSRARYYYVTGNMKKARYYFVRSEWNFKTLAYYLTTFFGSEYVKKRFNIFG